MAKEYLLHSGEFIAHNDYKYKIEFYKVYDLHAVPEQINFDVEGGVAQVTVWSNNGSAYIRDSIPEWLSYGQFRAEPIEGTPWYKYTYSIACEPNQTGEDRTFEWGVYIEDGEGTGIASTSFIVTQSGSSPTGQMSVTPTVYSADYRRNLFNATVYYIGGDVTVSVTYSSGNDWVYVNRSQVPYPRAYLYSILVSANDGDARSATITFTGTYGTATLDIYQSGNPNYENN